jgi:peptidoglycan/xylan/chitin deacetylase (PgdA/CDA1 family)
LRLKKYHVIGWSLRSGDSVITKEEELLKRITGRLGPGDIVLFHDTRSVTVNILEKFITFARAAGLRFERLDKHLEIEAYGKN